MVFNDILNMKFNKKDIYEASLCETCFENGRFCVIYLGDIVGVLNDGYLLDFGSGNVYSVIDIDSDTKNKPIGKYVLSPRKLYDSFGRISPMDVLCDSGNVRKR